MHKFIVAPTADEKKNGEAKKNAEAAKSVPELRVIVAELCARVADLEKQVSDKKSPSQ